MEMNSQIDITDILPSIRVPTLVIHRSEDVLIDIEAGRLLGSAIPGARYVELPGADHLPWAGDIPRITAAIEEFLQATASPAEPDTVLATVVCIDVSPQESGADESLENDITAAVEHHRNLYRGRKLGREGAIGIYSFDGPARAIHFALEVLNRLRKFDFRCSAGIHIGEISIGGGNRDNQTVSAACELCALAPPEQIIVSRTITDLVAGSGFEFEELAPVRLESLDRDWPLFRVES